MASEVTILLGAVTRGDKSALDRMLPLVYDELHRLAQSYLRRERSDHTLQPTALVNEAYLKLVDQHSVEWANRAHFLGVAAQVMRRVLAQHWAHKNVQKRGGGELRVTLDESLGVGVATSLDFVDLDRALDRLS